MADSTSAHPSFFQSHMLADMRGGRRAPGAPAWSPDGRQIAFLWASDDSRRQVWAWSPDTGEMRQLTKAPFRAAGAQRSLIDRTWVDRPRWSPDGRMICCAGTQGYEPRTGLWLVTPEGELSRLTADPGAHRSPAWSPDGRQIAFVSYREGKDELWVTGLDHDPALQLIWDRYHNCDPQWSPDGRAIAFTTQRYDGDPLITQIALLDMATGAVEVLTEGGRIHSRYPRWAPDGQSLLFLSDRSGYDEIWRLDLRTERSEPLTWSEGGQEKEGEFAVSPDGRRLAFKQARRTAQDLGVQPIGGQQRRLNSFDGVCLWPAWSPDGNRVAVLAEAPHMPPEIRVFDVDSAREAAATTCSPAPAITSNVEMVSFPTFDDRHIEAVLYTGSPAAPGDKRPAILNIHGGPNAQETFNYDPYLQRLARDGYIILMPNCRGSTGHGRAFMDLNLKDWGGEDSRDWLAAVEWLKGLGYIDPKRIGIWGRSYGGYSTLIGLGKTPDVFCCGVCHFGPTDLAGFFQDTTVRHLMMHFYGLPWLNRDLYRAASPLTYVEAITSPLLILHGDQDEGVPHTESERIVRKLRDLQRDVEYVLYQGEGHGFDIAANVQDASERISAFFRKHLL